MINDGIVLHIIISRIINSGIHHNLVRYLSVKFIKT